MDIVFLIQRFHNMYCIMFYIISDIELGQIYRRCIGVEGDILVDKRTYVRYYIDVDKFKRENKRRV